MKKRLLYAAIGVFTVAVTGALSAARVSAAIKAALVEVALPGKPFFGQTGITVNNIQFGTGSDGGTLGITNLTLTNFNDAVSTVTIFQPALSPSAATCFGPFVPNSGPPNILMNLRLQPNQTLSVPFPSPLVVPSVNGHSCIVAEGPPGLFEADVTGFVN